LYGCETWSPTLREDYGLSRVVRIFGAEKDDFKGAEGKLTFVFLAIKKIELRGVEMKGQVARMGEKTSEYIVRVREPEGKRPLRRSRRRWDDSIILSRFGGV
jgi:hypothetical protein